MSSLTAATVPSPAQSHTTTSTPSGQPSPAIHNPVPPPQQPQSTTSTPTPASSRPTTAAPASNMPWPMPTVAANTSPVIAGASPVQAEQQRSTNYYRQARANPQLPPPPIKAVPPPSHQFVYQQANGKSNK